MNKKTIGNYVGAALLGISLLTGCQNGTNLGIEGKVNESSTNMVVLKNPEYNTVEFGPEEKQVISIQKHFTPTKTVVRGREKTVFYDGISINGNSYDVTKTEYPNHTELMVGRYVALDGMFQGRVLVLQDYGKDGTIDRCDRFGCDEPIGDDYKLNFLTYNKQIQLIEKEFLGK